MRPTSYRNLLWIIALTGSFCVAAPAATPATTAQTPHPVTTTVAPAPSQQLSMVNSGQMPTQIQGRVETASMVPDSASLLPVAAVVGFSFLLGGIVCGTIKKRS